MQSSSQAITTNKPTPCFLQAECPCVAQPTVSSTEGLTSRRVYFILSQVLHGAWFSGGVMCADRCPYSSDFDWQNPRERPDSYHTYGAAVIQVQVDCLSGEYTVDQLSYS